MDSKEIEKRRIAFDDYSRRDDNGTEYWSARDIMKPLGYSRWENFNEAIKRAIISCETSKTPVECHFREVTKMVQSGVAKKPIVDFMLTRFACYLIAQNGDPRKDEIALAQAYTACERKRKRGRLAPPPDRRTYLLKNPLGSYRNGGTFQLHCSRRGFF